LANGEPITNVCQVILIVGYSNANNWLIATASSQSLRLSNTMF